MEEENGGGYKESREQRVRDMKSNCISPERKVERFER
jgi:hypothetical protein